MQSVYQHLRSLFYYSDESQESGRTKTQQDAQTYKPDTSQRRAEKLKTENVKIQKLQRQTRHFSGIVSEMNECCGMVDKKVFFDLAVVVGGRRPTVGSSAHVIAERPHPHAGWKASRVEITSPWKPEEQSKKRILIGYISQLSRTKGVVTCENEEVIFSADACNSSINHYWPHASDYVQVTLLQQDGETIVSELCPLREKQITGHVTSVCHGYGTIDGDVYFTFSACAPRGFAPQKGEVVKAACVEYKHNKSNWRAFLVEPVSQDLPDNKRSPASPLPPTLTPFTHLTVQRNEAEVGVAVSESIDFGEIQIGEEKKLNFTITNQCGRGTALLTCRPIIDDPQLRITQPLSWCGCGHSTSHDHSRAKQSCDCDGGSCDCDGASKQGCECDGGSKQDCGCDDGSKQYSESLFSENGVDEISHSLSESAQNGQREEKSSFSQSDKESRSRVESSDKDSRSQDESSDKDSHSQDESLADAGSVYSVSEGTGKDCENVKQLTSTGLRHIHIEDGATLNLELTLHASTLGLVNVVLLMTFAEGVKIARYVRGSVVDPRVLSLAPTTAYSRQRNKYCLDRGLYHARMSSCQVPGERPLKLRPLKLPNRLKLYKVLQDLRACVEDEGGEGRGDGVDLETLDFIRPCLGEPLCMENYSERFSTLLHLEELKKEEDMMEFNMYSASPRRHGSYITLSVPGLAEGRPSLLVGDRAVFSVPDEEGVRGQLDGVRGQRDGVRGQLDPSWEGYIHEVRGEEILLRFAEVFHENFDNEDYDVMFTFNRTPLRRMHHAAELAEAIGTKTLFPRKPTPKPPCFKLGNLTVPIPYSKSSTPPHLQDSINPLHSRKYFNPVLNRRQRAAVSRIVRGQCRPSPYILFGPPGTGKTVTVVEAILQVYMLSSSTRILACAPSNSAADLLAERLHESGVLSPGQMVRLNALQRSVTPAPIIEPYCTPTDSANSAARCRIVVATCVTSGLLHALGLGAGHFTHVFVDEAGQATEPECLLPVSLLAGSEGQVVLAGDPQQLGPILTSSLAGEGGLALSLLERLMEREPYLRDCVRFQDHGNYDPLMVTKLVENYRSHEAILQLYSDAFYHSELRPMADQTLIHALDDWNELPAKGFPLLFHGVLGEDMREGNSPSWFNPVEAVQVVKYVQALLDNDTFAPKISEIGVITPYRKQGEKIRLLLQSVGVQGVKVGSVEEFQGQERLAIILSTVRSSQEFVGFDARHHLGFLSNQKRFNVAISRAQALLVVVGNPHLLCQDVYWCKLVDYALSNNSYRGCALPECVEHHSREGET